MAYEDARTQIKTVLATVKITSPERIAIKKVYEDPAGTVEDHPCFILYGSTGEAEWTLHGAATGETHIERCRLLVYDSDLDRAARLVRAFRAATIAAFKTESGLGGHAVISSFRWEQPSAFPYGGRDFTSLDFLIGFRVKVP